MWWRKREPEPKYGEPTAQDGARLREAIQLEARCGYRSEAAVVDAFRQRLEHAEGLAPEAVTRWIGELQAALVEQRAIEASWIELTHNDRIDRAFAELTAHGIIAEQDAGETMSDGWTIVGELSDDHPSAWGATFFHRQDVERGVAGEGLLLAFGAFTEDADHADKSRALAREVCETLARHGVVATWHGDLDRRIAIEPFVWRKRRTTTAPA